MTDNDRQQTIEELESQIDILEAENNRLVERAEEVLLLGMVAEASSSMDQPADIFADTLERISLLKAYPIALFVKFWKTESPFYVHMLHFAKITLKKIVFLSHQKS